jgi:hypothetical protein
LPTKSAETAWKMMNNAKFKIEVEVLEEWNNCGKIFTQAVLQNQYYEAFKHAYLAGRLFEVVKGENNGNR